MRLVARGTAGTPSPSSQVDAIYSCPPALAAGSDHPALNHRGAWKVEGGFAALACPRWRLRLFLCRVLCGAVNGTRALDANWGVAAGGWAPWRWKKCPWQTASARAAAREARRRTTPAAGISDFGSRLGGGFHVYMREISDLASSRWLKPDPNWHLFIREVCHGSEMAGQDL